MKPISDTISGNFISRELVKRHNVSIYSCPYIKYGSGDRNIKGYVDGMYKKIIASDKFPFFILLNIKYSGKADTKHAMAIAVTKNHGQYTVGLFDSNGKLGTGKVDNNIRKIIEGLAEKLNCEAFEYMDTNINTLEGPGNCDALSLWFIYSNKDSNTKAEIQKKVDYLFALTEAFNIESTTLEINKEITRLSKLK